MATQVQNRRGTTAEHSTFTGANGELTVDTTKRTLVVHDGATAGGRPLLREDQSNLPTSAPTTGIYNASGSLAISTGGSGRLFINGDGTISAGAVVTGNGGIVVFDTSGQTTANLSTSTNNGSFIVARHNDANGGAGGAFLVGAQGGAFAAIKGLLTDGSNNTAGDLAFSTRATSAASTLSECLRIDSSARLLLGTSSDSGGALLQVNGDRIRVGTAKTPASATATGTAGEICWDASYVYVCTATNTWKRSALSTW